MWFHEIGFDQNPFDASVSHKLVGYDGIMDEVLYNIHAGNIVFIEGPEGFGKTAVLKKAIESFKGNGRVAYVECQKVKELNIENVLKGKYNFIQRLFRPTPRDMIVLIDDVSELDKKNTERLKYYYDQNYASSVILAGENYGKASFTASLRDRVKKVIKLNAMNYYEAIDLLNSRLRGKRIISEDAAREILERTEGNRRKFLKACEELCKAMVENKEEAVTIEQIEKLLPKIKKSAEVKKPAEKIAEKPAKKSAGKKRAKESEDDQEIKVVYEGPEDVAERYY